MSFVLTTDASSEPVTLAEAKAHLRVDHSDDDTLIGLLISAARQTCEALCNRSFIEQVWTLSLDAFPTNCGPRSFEEYMARQSHATIQVRRAQLMSVESIKYYDSSNVQQTLSPTEYQVDAKSLVGRVRPAANKSWPSTYDRLNAVEVVVKLGYGTDATSVPKSIKQAILLLVGMYYQNREAVVGGTDPKALPKPEILDLILMPYKVVFA